MKQSIELDGPIYKALVNAITSYLNALNKVASAGDVEDQVFCLFGNNKHYTEYAMGLSDAQHSTMSFLKALTCPETAIQLRNSMGTEYQIFIDFIERLLGFFSDLEQPNFHHLMRLIEVKDYLSDGGFVVDEERAAKLIEEYAILKRGIRLADHSTN